MGDLLKEVAPITDEEADKASAYVNLGGFTNTDNHVGTTNKLTLRSRGKFLLKSHRCAAPHSQ
jgi:hypothetical protein